MRSRCYVCNVDVPSLPVHMTTDGHRRRTSSIQSSGPRGSHAYSPRREAVRQAYSALARWDEQYEGETA